MNDNLERGLLGRVLQREAARWWWAPLVAGVAWFVIGWLVLRANYTSLTTVGVLLGFAFLMAAINEGALGAMMHGGWAVLHYALAVFFVLGAVWAFVHPVNSFFALASVLGLLLFLQGIFTLTRGLALRDESPYWWLDVTAGGLLTVLAIWISTSDRAWNLADRAFFILIWVGFMAIFRGVSDVALAFSLRRLATQDIPAPRRAAGVPQASVAGDAPRV
jgi:uncharacterized membrane protein HdeD (DUF308 family)